MDEKTFGEHQGRVRRIYRSVFKAWDEPKFVEHFTADAPIDIKALLFFPSFHTESMGMSRLEPAVSLYCRKVLIESPCRDLVPEWMRFVKGVVDSEDLPLSISREKSQDRQLLGKIRDVVVRKSLRFLKERLEKDRDAYLDWYEKFNPFLKEGACHDETRRRDIGKLLFFDTSKRADEKTSLDEYVSRLKGDDDHIYYLQAPSREAALASPYYEAFVKNDKECLFVYSTVDDFVMSSLAEFNGRKIKSAESFRERRPNTRRRPPPLTEWFVHTLGDRLESCELTDRLLDSPAVVTDVDYAAVRRMMLLVNQQQAAAPPFPNRNSSLNPDHATIRALDTLTSTDHDVAITLAHQLLDNALVAAGLMDDARTMLPRLNKLLELAALRPPPPPRTLLHSLKKTPQQRFKHKPIPLSQPSEEVVPTQNLSSKARSGSHSSSWAHDDQGREARMVVVGLGE